MKRKTVPFVPGVPVERRELEDYLSQLEHELDDPAVVYKPTPHEIISKIRSEIVRIYSQNAAVYESVMHATYLALSRLRPGESCRVASSERTYPVARRLGIRVRLRKLREGGYEATRIE